MKYILSLSIALAGAVVLPITSFAEDAAKPGGPGGHRGGPGGPGGGRGGMPNAEERVKHMKETLNLTDEQTTKITDIFKKSAESAKAVMDAGGDRETNRPKMEEIRKGAREEVEAVLTPEQKEKWKTEMEKRRAEHPGGGAPGGAAPAK